ncbi:Molybdopterin-guanine dinucleotide biosynthesis adapter protein [Candidatus Terasakiella magnetica]|uniref:Molybdopterin-guanine dinucleotide biosynthesis adapter protein n=1 Tax=Candidatus Terasakiella magnetica TaxID=1867952 RepID=A0A1C3RLZ1_9PROT|nr:molybdopterin-guanine dinucleotide biosynthesis protein B [Candidatus Terasakiella magnetica]SCA58248.1 Molybdopterin-guanine dinucleotide biosynthesis adapter protein [Candidatus Terasakiella magnetica]
MKVFGIVGKSGSGKTTLLEDLIPAIAKHGISVSTIKHTHHQFDMDKPGKDSYRQREAGAQEVLLASSKRWALLHELRDEKEPEIEEFLPHMTKVDLLLVEGFKYHDHPKIEVHRPSYGRPALWPEDQTILAIASDEKFETDGRGLIDLNDAEAIAAFIIDHLQLRK